MIKQFKEIDVFFKNDSFSDTELNKLRASITNIYKDKNSIKLANSIIELHILKFEMKVNELQSIRKPLKNELKQPIKSKKPNIIKQPKTKKIKSVGTEGMNLDEVIEYLRGKNIMKIINEITETKGKELFLNILREKGIYRGSIGVILTNEEYDDIKGQLNDILKTNQKRDTSLRIKTGNKVKINRSITNSSTVYDKIKTMNGLGKVIYIRSK